MGKPWIETLSNCANIADADADADAGAGAGAGADVGVVPSTFNHEGAAGNLRDAAIDDQSSWRFSWCKRATDLHVAEHRT